MYGTIEKMLRQLAQDLETIGGCGDGNCCIHRRGGQHTNGGCKCAYQPDRAQQRKLEKTLRVYQRFIHELDDSIMPSLGELLGLGDDD